MEVFGEWIAIVAHSCESILGIIAIWALIFHRKKISALARLIAHTIISERVKRIKGILGRLDSLNYANKEDRKEIIAILGQLSGMVRLIADRNVGFKDCHGELKNLSEKPEGLSEATKRRVSEELHALLDEQGFGAALSLMEQQHGHKSTTSHS